MVSGDAASRERHRADEADLSHGTGLDFTAGVAGVRGGSADRPLAPKPGIRTNCARCGPGSANRVLPYQQFRGVVGLADVSTHLARLAGLLLGRVVFLPQLAAEQPAIQRLVVRCL